MVIEIKTKCFLCGKEAERDQFKLGKKYECNEHPWYCLNAIEHGYLKIHFRTKPEDKKKFIDWLWKNPPEKGESFREITISDIEKILGIRLS